VVFFPILMSNVAGYDLAEPVLSVYTLGVYFALEDLDNTVFSQLIGKNGYTGWSSVSAVIQKLIGSRSDLDNETYAAFAQSTYDVNEWL